MIVPTSSSVNARILKFSKGAYAAEDDVLVVEEPLEMGLKTESDVINIGITMRTPGDDRNLVLGFLYSEGIIGSLRNLKSLSFKDEVDATLPASRALVQLVDPSTFDTGRFQRAFPISAACGACGKSALETLRIFRKDPLPFEGQKLSAELLQSLGNRLFERQSLFANTGGLHAAARFSCSGDFMALAEDIGRHNALDKLIGASLQSGDGDWSGDVLVLSGRIGFDLIQKAIVIGSPIVVAIGAPSSLAVELANFYKITLVGFLRETRFNVYSSPERILF